MKKFIFIIGLHRSGTTFLLDIFRRQHNISGLKYVHNNFHKNEGQYYQKVLKTDEELGWIGKIAYSENAHQTEESEILKKYNAEDFFNSLKPNLQNPTSNVIVEKSPPYITQTRLLQKMFPNSYFVVIIRHPIFNTLSTKEFVKNRYEADEHELMNHWFKAHKILFEDLKYINNKIVLTYEELANNTLKVINALEEFVNEKFNDKDFFAFNSNTKYKVNKYEFIIHDIMCNTYGYSTKNLNLYLPIEDLNSILL